MTRSNNDVLDRLHALSHSFRHHMREAMRVEGDGLGPMEVRCLRYFAHHKGATQSDLVQHAGRDKAQIARIVKGLVERGLLLSQPHPDDRRSQVLSVSEAGRALQKRMAMHQLRFEKRLMAGLDDNEREQLIALLARLQDNVADS